MRTGKLVAADEHNPGLEGEWIEVFPEGNLADLTITTAIPREHKRASGRAVFKGQSPLLVRLEWWTSHGPKQDAAINPITK